MCVCVCVRARDMRACVRACVCERSCVRACVCGEGGGSGGRVVGGWYCETDEPGMKKTVPKIIKSVSQHGA